MPISGEFAQNDAETIIQQSLNITKTQLYVDGSVDINTEDLKRIDAIVERRLRGEPLQYIFGKAFFYDREFAVNTDVLIPRPDTETLIEIVINTEKNHKAYFIDVGTGSGIIPIILTAHRPEWSAVAVDVSYKATRTAARNVLGEGRHHKNIHIICSDMFSAIKPEKQFDFITSNPPYISSIQLAGLDKSVVGYEPRAALYGGDDGLDFYRVISSLGRMYLKDGGRVYLEIGYDQGESVPRIFGNDGWEDINVIKDLGGRDRVIRARGVRVECGIRNAECGIKRSINYNI
jgi:release factor glutamine methyltransferase